jgi:hypothetical protein
MSDADPQWLRDAVAAAWRELRAYVAVVRLATARPRRFHADWAEGRVTALNPLAATLNAAAFLGPWRLVWASVRHDRVGDKAWWLQLVAPLIALARVFVLGILCHVAAWCFGSRRPLRTTIGAVLYCAAGPMTVVAFALTPILPSAEALNNDHWRENLSSGLRLELMILGALVPLLSSALVALAVSGAQRRQGWRSTTPIVLAMVLYWFAAGWVQAHHATWLAYLR